MFRNLWLWVLGIRNNSGIRWMTMLRLNWATYFAMINRWERKRANEGEEKQLAMRYFGIVMNTLHQESMALWKTSQPKINTLHQERMNLRKLLIWRKTHYIKKVWIFENFSTEDKHTLHQERMELWKLLEDKRITSRKHEYLELPTQDKHITPRKHESL